MRFDVMRQSMIARNCFWRRHTNKIRKTKHKKKEFSRIQAKTPADFCFLRKKTKNKENKKTKFSRIQAKTSAVYLFFLFDEFPWLCLEAENKNKENTKKKTKFSRIEAKTSADSFLFFWWSRLQAAGCWLAAGLAGWLGCYPDLLDRMVALNK